MVNKIFLKWVYFLFCLSQAFGHAQKLYQFKYGYQVRNLNDQFQHKYKSSDNVTYGCYGFTHPADGGMQRIFYIADQFGYRTVLIGQQTTIYPAPGTSPVLKEWQELPFPAACLNRDAGNSQIIAESTNNPIQPSFDDSRSSLMSASSDVKSIVIPYSHSKTDIHIPVSSDINPLTEPFRLSSSSSECWRSFAGDSTTSFMKTVQCASNDKSKIVTLFFPFRIACTDMEEFEKELRLLVSKFDNLL
uniref:Uncharacterized protein n=1 Tax=Anopheles funestus TaxID=62324 RepID=A0A182R8K9_ANOFN